MQVDYAFILAAGHGTRMGAIGKRLPKPLWPLFEGTLLDLQIGFARELNVKKIFINAHHLSESIVNYVKDADIEVVLEPNLLGPGGGVLNMAKNLHSGIAIKLDADVFMSVPEVYLEEELNWVKLHQRPSLFPIKISAGGHYNQTEIINNQLMAISRAPESDYFTYSGVGLLPIESLPAFQGEQGFFDSVANFKKEHVRMRPCSEVEYWDFGTLEHYIESSFRVLNFISNAKASKFCDLLQKLRLINPSKIQGPNCYNCKGKGINLGPLENLTLNGQMILKGSPQEISNTSRLFYVDTWD